MPVALQTSVDIELLIEGRRDELFIKLTSQVPPPQYIPPQHASTSQAPSSYVDIEPSLPCLNAHPLSPSDVGGPLFHVHPLAIQVGTPEMLPSAQSAEAGPQQSHALVDKPPSYFVLESYLSAGGSERVFEVKYDDSEHFYYAFEFNEYVACPAFLASLFNLTNYACLDVSSNGSHYHYIFLSREDDDQLPIILEGESKFVGKFELKVPSADRILPLNPKTKDMKCFIMSLGGGQKLRAEGLVISSQLTDKLLKSEAVPSYWFVPTGIMNLFTKNHPSPLTCELVQAMHLVHESSKSYVEFKGITEPVRKSPEEVKLSIVPLETIFTATKYKREDYILNTLTNHIRRNYLGSKESKVETYYCSMIAVLQSSGYGKSKLMEKLSARTPTFYSSLQRGMGFPKESFFLARLIAELDRIIKETISHKIYFYMNNVSMVVYIYILRILFVILKTPNNKSLKNFQIDPEIIKHNFFSGIVGVNQSSKREEIFKILFKGLEEICRHEEDVDFDGINTLELKDIPIAQRYSLNSFSIEIHSKKALTSNLEVDVMALLGKLEIKKADLPSIFVIDEAHGLRYKDYNKDGGVKYNWSFRDKNLSDDTISDAHERSPYNVFRRVFRIFKNTWERIILIVISTSGQMSVLLPEWRLDPSRRPGTSSRFIESFALVQTYSVNSETVQSLTADMFPNQGIKDWNEFLKSDFRKREYFKFGRPLIYGIFLKNVVNDLRKYELEGKFEYDLEAKFDECGEFNFMASKLFGGKEYGETSNISLLYGMFNFAFGTNFLPSYVSKEDLIENHLMTLVKFLDEYKFGASYIVGGFLPEGVINFLSARHFVKYPGSLTMVFYSSVKYGLCDIGNFGELLAQFILLQNIFKCIDTSFENVRKLVFQPVFLKDFLQELAGVQYNSIVEEYFGFNPFLEGSQVSFGYFEHFPEKPIKNPFDLMARLLFRGSATTLDGYYPSIDLLIPLVLRDGKISFIGIQVKYITKREGADSAVNKALMKMNFPSMFPTHRGRKSDRPFALIILIIGDYVLEVSIQKKGGLNASKLKNKYYLVEPVTLVFKGMQAKDIKLPEIAPVNASYHGIYPEYLEACDRMHDLTHEMPQEEDPSPKRARKDNSPSDVASSLSQVAQKRARTVPKPPAAQEADLRDHGTKLSNESYSVSPADAGSSSSSRRVSARLALSKPRGGKNPRGR